jgi:LPXTG-motif cell wall-anchored protein
MKAEKTLWWLAMACGVLLLTSWFNPKTMRVSLVGEGQSIQGWGWQNVATWAGVFVLVALVVGRINRPRVPRPALCAGFAVVIFGGAAAEAARTWIDLTKEAANPDLYGYGRDYVLLPATGMARTIAIAIAGAIFSLVLLGTWLRPEAKW